MGERTKIFKKVLFPLVSLFLVFQSYKLTTVIPHISNVSLIYQFIIAWFLNMFVTGIFALTGFAYPTQRLLPKSYYYVSNPTFLTKIYKLMGVDLFRKFLLSTIWKDKGRQKQFFNGTKKGIIGFNEQSQKSEFGHLIPLIILSIISMYFLIENKIGFAIFTMVWNLLGNLFPILLQRYHRMRIQKVMRRLRK